MTLVLHPTPGFAGVDHDIQFTGGSAAVNDDAALEYLSTCGRGFTVGSVAYPVVVGSRLRDAAVDPLPGDAFGPALVVVEDS